MNAINAIQIAFLLSSFYFASGDYSLSKNCTHLLHNLAAKQSLYVSCSTSHAVPVGICTQCNFTYRKMQAAYSNITKSENCSKVFFDNDRINVIQTTQNMLLDLWKKAYCDDCKPDSYKQFHEYLQNFQKCFNETKDDKQKCELCLNSYLDLNAFYTSLDQQNKGHICYDMQDAMNQTRVIWSKELNCCHREFRMNFFLLSTICVGTLPIVFYVSAFVLTKRRERNHAMLQISDRTEAVRPMNDQTLAAQQAVQNAAEGGNSIAPTVQESNNSKLHKNFTFESSDSDIDDDDSIP